MNYLWFAMQVREWLISKSGKTTQSAHCTITGPCLHMPHASQAFSTASVPTDYSVIMPSHFSYLNWHFFRGKDRWAHLFYIFIYTFVVAFFSQKRWARGEHILEAFFLHYQLLHGVTVLVLFFYSFFFFPMYVTWPKNYNQVKCLRGLIPCVLLFFYVFFKFFFQVFCKSGLGLGLVLALRLVLGLGWTLICDINDTALM